MQEFRIFLRNIKIIKKVIAMDVLALLIFLLIIHYSFQYSEIPEPEKGNVFITASVLGNSAIIDRMKIRIDITGIYVSLRYFSDDKSSLYLLGNTFVNNLNDIFIKEVTGEYDNFIHIDNLGQSLDKEIWKKWIDTPFLTFPQKIELDNKEISLNSSSYEIILKFYPLNFQKRFYFSFHIENSQPADFPIIIQIGEGYRVDNKPDNFDAYTYDIYVVSTKSLNTTFEISRVMWYDKVNLTLFASLSAIAFFAYSLYLSILSGNEIKKSVEKDLKESSEKLNEKSNDMQKKIEELTKEQRRTIMEMDDLSDKQEELKKGMDNLNKKLADLNKKQTRRKSRK